MDIAPKYIIAGSYNEYQLYVKEKIPIYGPISTMKSHKWVADVYSIKGLNDISGVFIGTWADRDDIADIIAEICNIKSRFSDWDMPIEIAKVYNKKMREFYQKELQNAVSVSSNYMINPQPANNIVFTTTISG